jgi:hypothetical protein
MNENEELKRVLHNSLDLLFEKFDNVDEKLQNGVKLEKK